MMAKTHTISSMSLGLLPFAIFPSLVESIPLEAIKFYLIGLGIGAVLPDIDEPNSSIGRRTLFISYFLNKMLGHRGLTHKFIVVPALLFLTLFFWNNFIPGTALIMVGITFGVLFHQFGDFIAGDPIHKGGIEDYFWPFIAKKHKKTQLIPRIFRCVVGGIKEHLYLGIFMLLFLLEIYLIFGKLILNIKGIV